MLTRGSMSAPVGADISYCSLERLPCLVLLTAFLIWGRVRLDETYCLSGFERLYDLVITYCWSGSERPHGPDDTYVYGGSWSGRDYDLTDSTLYCGSIWIWAHFRRNDTNLESGFKLSVLWHDDSYCLSGTDIFASQGSSVHFYLSGSEGTYGLMIFTATLDLSGLSACWYLIWVLLWARLQNNDRCTYRGSVFERPHGLMISVPFLQRQRPVLSSQSPLGLTLFPVS